MSLIADWERSAPSLPDAACKDLTPQQSDEIFFKGRASYAKRFFCDRCSVKAECLQWALDTEAYGTWGGTSRKERNYIKKMLRHKLI